MQKKLRTLITLAGLSLLAAAAATVAQTPASSPAPSEEGNYTVTSSIELGVRGLSVNGDHEKFRSDLNYKPGFRIFDSTFLIEDRSKGVKLFDTAMITSSGWGFDPSGSFRMNMDRTGIFKFDTNVRRLKYYNNLKNHATPWSFPIGSFSQHQMNTLRHFGDFDLTVFPESENFRLRFGYSFNNQDGPGAWTIRFPAFEAPTLPGSSGTRGDEFQVNSTFKTNSQDFRAGVEGKLLGFNLGLNYGHRMFKDETRLFLDVFSFGNDPRAGTSNAVANFYNRRYPTKGSSDYFNFYAQQTFAQKFDFTGRFIYSLSTTDVDQRDEGSGSSTPSGTSYPRILIDLDQILVTGKVKRPQSRGDIGLTYRATENFRVSNTFTFDQYNIGGTSNFLETLQGRNPTDNSTFTALFNALFTRGTSYRRFTNLIEADYQVNNYFAFNVGYRYTHRKVGVGAFEFDLRLDEVEESDFEEFQNSTHAVIVGTRIKPTKNWSIFADFEKGESDNVFTRLANNKYTAFRVRSIANLKRFTLNLSGVIRNNDNPGTSEPITSSGGFPATETIANTRTRYFSASIDWTPTTNWSFNAGYTLNHQTNDTDVIVPVGSPIRSSTAWFLGKSMYYVRDNSFYFDVTAKPVKRVTFYAAYRINDDQGQGSRIQTRPEDIITSYPMRYQSPEVRLAFRLTRNIDWNVGYQYYSYSETPLFNPFAWVVISGQPNRLFTNVPAQNYTAHMPYTSLRIYFGRAADR